MNAHTKRQIRKIISPFRRIGLKNFDFSIISNNCWGVLYDVYGLQYRSPTIGMYFFADDYVKFINNLPQYLSLQMQPLKIEASRHKEEIIKNGNVNSPLGYVGDVEVVFVHYKSAEEGCKKWNSRRKRVNYNNLLVKFSDQNFFSDAEYEAFIASDFKHKLFFTSNRKYLSENYCVFIEKYEDNGYVVDDIKVSRNAVQIKKILNSLPEG